MKVRIPVATVSEMNRHESYWVTWKRSKMQKQVTLTYLLSCSTKRPTLPVHVKMTRYFPGELDTDNLDSAFKWIRDAIAYYLGCGDSPRDPITWEVDQVRTKEGDVAVVVEINELKGVVCNVPTRLRSTRAPRANR